MTKKTTFSKCDVTIRHRLASLFKTTYSHGCVFVPVNMYALNLIYKVVQNVKIDQKDARADTEKIVTLMRT